VPELQLLRAEHAPAVRAFEPENRAYFVTFISDRGEEFFDHFDDSFDKLLAEQEGGTCMFHVLIDENGKVLGRFNYSISRTAQPCSGTGSRNKSRGVATATVKEIVSQSCRAVRASDTQSGDQLGQRCVRKGAGKSRFRPRRPR
jgi:ribosomal-protein-alanine N-acetyltransferase